MVAFIGMGAKGSRLLEGPMGLRRDLRDSEEGFKGFKPPLQDCFYF